MARFADRPVLAFDHAPSPEEIVQALMARGQVQEAITFKAITELMYERHGGNLGAIDATDDDILDKIAEMGLSDAWYAGASDR